MCSDTKLSIRQGQEMLQDPKLDLSGYGSTLVYLNMYLSRRAKAERDIKLSYFYLYLILADFAEGILIPNITYIRRFSISASPFLGSY